MSTKTTYKQTELGLIPTDWDFDNMGNLSKVNQGLQIPISDRFSEQVENSLFYITNEFLKEDSKNKYFIKNPPKSVIANKDDVLMTRTGNTGKVVTGVEGAFHNNFFKIKYDETKLNKDFLVGYLKSPRTQYSILTLSGNSTIPDLNHSDFYRIKIPLPPLPEQKKIADCLSTWDVAIEKQSQLINALTDRKKALMQQLITGKKRLPGFSDEWKEVKLGSLGKTYNGLTGKTKEDFGEGKPFITYMNIFSNPKINISNFEYVKMGVNENQNKAIYGDIFFTVSSETPNEVGMASVLLDEINDLYLNSFCFGFRLNDFKNLLPEFSSYLFRNDLFRKDVYKLAQGSTRFNLSKLELMKIKIKLPSLSEQTAIAEILATADRELTLQKEKLAQLQTLKKGLMQVLLTGKKRLIN